VACWAPPVAHRAGPWVGSSVVSPSCSGPVAGLQLAVWVVWVGCSPDFLACSEEEEEEEVSVVPSVASARVSRGSSVVSEEEEEEEEEEDSRWTISGTSSAGWPPVPRSAGRLPSFPRLRLLSVTPSSLASVE